MPAQREARTMAGAEEARKRLSSWVNVACSASCTLPRLSLMALSNTCGAGAGGAGWLARWEQGACCSQALPTCPGSAQGWGAHLVALRVRELGGLGRGVRLEQGREDVLAIRAHAVPRLERRGGRADRHGGRNLEDKTPNFSARSRRRALRARPRRACADLHLQHVALARQHDLLDPCADLRGCLLGSLPPRFRPGANDRSEPLRCSHLLLRALLLARAAPHGLWLRVLLWQPAPCPRSRAAPVRGARRATGDAPDGYYRARASAMGRASLQCNCAASARFARAWARRKGLPMAAGSTRNGPGDPAAGACRLENLLRSVGGGGRGSSRRVESGDGRAGSPTSSATAAVSCGH